MSSRKNGGHADRRRNLVAPRSRGAQLLGAPDLTELAGQHELHPQGRLAVAEHVRQRAKRPGHVPFADGAWSARRRSAGGSRGPAPRHPRCVIEARAPTYRVSCSSACARRPSSGPADSASVATASALIAILRARASRVIHPPSSRSRRGAHLVQEAGLAQDLERLEAAVDLLAHQDQAALRAGIGGILGQRRQLVGLHAVDPLADHQAPGGHHGQRAGRVHHRRRARSP